MTGAQVYVYWRAGDAIQEDKDVILLKDNLAQHETCALLVRNTLLCACVLLLLLIIVKLGSLVSLTEWSNISERNSKLIENLKKGPELTL